jgi:hypothetical protein
VSYLVISHRSGQAKKEQGKQEARKSIADAAQWGRVVDWLFGIEMGHYADIFEEQGLTSLSAIELLEKKDLDEMKVASRDQEKILTAILAFSQKTNDSIVGLDPNESLGQWILGAFENGTDDIFWQAWEKLPEKVRDESHQACAVAQKLEFYLRT